VSSWHQQALIEAPVEDVWTYVADPGRYPQWLANVVGITGPAEIAPDAEFRQVTRTRVGKFETTYKIEKLDDLREIKLRCQSGYYSRWFLTPAQDSTFVDVEIGVEPAALQYRLFFGAMGKRYLRRIAEQALDGLRAELAGNPPRIASSPGARSGAAAT
jgi:uncharacterized protein YndB with AHSA1/START domain